MRRGNLLLIIIVLIGLGAIALPGTAQEPLPPVFATNTPMAPSVIISTPAAPQDRYALRGWQAGDLLAVLQARVQQLAPGLVESQKAVRLVQYELERRFPGEPRDPAAGERLLRAMLAAPPGSVDMRAIARPYLQGIINGRANVGVPVAFEQAGFQIEMLAANLDGLAPPDAVFHIRYPGSAAPVVYEDYVPAVRDDNGRYRLLAASDLPATPSGDIETLLMMAIDDLNGDGLDELALSIHTNDINSEIRIFGWRNDDLASLIPPGQALYFGELISGLNGQDDIEVKLYRQESPTWGCLGEREMSWRWNANFFRPVPTLDGFFFQNTANCLFYGAEPLFAMPTEEALTTINEILAFVSDENDLVAQRAHMIELMLRTLDGDIGTALALALELETSAEPESWLAGQISTFITALGIQGVHPLEICAALVEARADGACDVDSALARILAANRLQRSQPIDEQLAALGITLLDQITVSQVGRADRQMVHFNLAGERWWAFAPLDPEFYTAEMIDPPPGFTIMTAPLPVIVAPASMYDALLVNDDPAAVLTVLDNLLREHPQTAISPEARFLQALSFDLLGDRSRARQAYFELWRDSPLSIWGQLAADHLERR